MSLLHVEDLSIAFHQGKHVSPIVNTISFDIAPSETLALVGESGSGKSLTAYSIMRLLPYPAAFHPSGKIIFDDKDLLALPLSAMREIRGNRIGMIFQEPMTALNPLHSVEKQIGEVIRLRHKVTPKQCREKVLALLDKVRITDPQAKLKAYPHQLSGGQRQRVMIAMALANQPQLLIADEPTTALDVTVQKNILMLLKELQQEYQMGVLLITHDLGVVSAMADRMLVMQRGQLVEQGETQALLNKPQQDYTKQLLNREPRGNPIPLGDNVDDLSPIMSTRSLGVSVPTHKPFWGKAQHVTILSDITLQLTEGSTLGIVGESGSGKSTLALAMLKLISATGDLYFAGKPIAHLKENALRSLRSDIQIVFQDPFASLSPRMTVKQIISEGLYLHYPAQKDENDAKIAKIMHEVGLDPSTQDRYPHEFSGGQRQRIAIARALILNPRVVFLDEPTSALDRAVQAQVIELLRALQRTRKLTYVFISHDMQVIKALSHRIIVMKSGVIVEQGDASKVLSQPSDPYTKTLISSTLSDI